MKIRSIALIITILLVTFVVTLDWLRFDSRAESAVTSKTIKYVAIGDSFTKGEGVQKHQAWTNLVVRKLQQVGLPVELVANPAKSGWTSAQLLEHQLKVVETYQPDLVTLLVGLNDYAFAGVKKEEYRQNLEKIISRLKELLPNPRGIVIINIPDFASTPYGKAYYKRFDKKDALPEFNKVISEIAAKNELEVVDLFSVSHDLASQQYMFVDRLHPSPLQHEHWANFLYPKLYKALREISSSRQG